MWQISPLPGVWGWWSVSGHSANTDTNPLIFSPLQWLTQLRPTLLLSLPTDTLRESPGRRSWPAQPREYDCNLSDHQEEETQSQQEIKIEIWIIVLHLKIHYDRLMKGCIELKTEWLMAIEDQSIV